MKRAALSIAVLLVFGSLPGSRALGADGERSKERRRQQSDSPDSHPRPIGPVQVLASGEFGGDNWSLSVFKGEYEGLDGSAVEATCMNAMGGICTMLPLGPAGSDVIGANTSTRVDGTTLQMGTVSKSAATLWLVSEGEAPIQVEILVADQVETPHNYYVVYATDAQAHLVAYDENGQVLEEESLASNSKPQL
jgi:hypothetical protein